MAEANYTGPECLFTGPDSGAEAGECTQMPSYLANYEMYEILVQAENPDLYSNISTIQYEDEGDVLIYNEMNWASWLSPSSYASRRSWTDGLNFSSTSNWAVDLNQTYFNNSTGDLLSTGLEDSFDMCDYSKTFDSLDDPLSPEQFAVLRLCCLLYSLGNGTQILCSELNSTDDNLTIAEKTTALTLSGSDSYEGTLATASLSPNWVTFGDYEKDVLFVTPHVS
ncbi:hypothetical protein MAP00_001202 [Monascus purpureus]|nr:hypothetical protein MAP00_001202 [Monascus purpureus]